ncbi:hypothetical protein IG626_02040 [Desulfovibrio desulfuricans]|uniref:hypothetical protein n=1 Tax=Desulfovibrio desulfuricans TaxID=876 RepID=UPI001784B2D8|nr:hypothetical protein [Desulfovibrio desulfuricans]MBD8894770.1 hypothetical protein [Desulfovibrio desulfuricans]
MSKKKTTVRDEKELGKAIKDDADYIEIEGDLKNKVLKIKATGKIAWGICLAALVVAVGAVALAIPTGGTSAAVSGLSAGAAATILGVGPASSAVMIAVAAGGTGALNKLRKYDIVENSNSLILKRNC